MLIINTQLMHGNHIYNSEVHERVYIYIYILRMHFLNLITTMRHPRPVGLLLLEERSEVD
jgi:hypothetical protein